MREDCYRMGFHLMPPKGWLNDPNGLCQFKGEYHVFFQYSPDSPLGGQKYWGHYISADLLRWRFAGIALSPDREFDRSGAYSGCAVVTGGEDGQQRMQIYYTGNVKLEGEYDYIDSGREANVVYTDSADGIHFSEKRLLLGNKDYPEGYTCHVRDPKVYFRDGMYHMALGGRRRCVPAGCKEPAEGPVREDRGAVLLYCSRDGLDWEFEREFGTVEPFGYMWECPDIFLIGPKTCLSFCPQGLGAEPYRFQNVDQSGYVWLEDAGDGTLDAGNFTEWDMGFDFYAPQTFEDEAGRRILIGWAGLPQAPYGNPTAGSGWQHCLTVPRELTFRDGKIRQNPVKELESLRENGQMWWGDGCVWTDDYSFCLEIGQMETECWELSLGDGLFLRYGKKVFTWEFADGKTEAGDWGSGRRVRRMQLERLRDIQVLCDRSILEIFVNGGSRVMCGRFYPPGAAQPGVEGTGQPGSAGTGRPGLAQPGSAGTRRPGTAQPGAPGAAGRIGSGLGGSLIRMRGCGAHAVTHFWHMKTMEVMDDETVIGDWGGTD